MKSIHGVWHRPIQQRVKSGLLAALAFLLLCGPALAAETRSVLVLGDSLSAGYGLGAQQGWVPLTAQRMKRTHPGWGVVNGSISGETTAGGATRIARELARVKPSIVVIELGANDGLRGLSLAQTRANLERMLQTAKTAKAKVLLVGMRLPPNYGPEYTQGFERVFAELAKKHDAVLLPFLLAPIASDRNAFQSDNMHPVAAAQPKLRDHVWKSLAPMLR